MSAIITQDELVEFGVYHKFSYHVVRSSTEPGEFFRQPSNLWCFQRNEKRLWFFFEGDSWKPIPPGLSRQKRGIHPYPALRLEPTDPPKWIYGDPAIYDKLRSATVACDQNRWLLEAFEIWTRQSLEHRRIDEVLHYLMLSPHPIPQLPLFYNSNDEVGDSRPTFRRAINSLKHFSNVIASGNYDGLPEINDSHFYSSGVTIKEFTQYFCEWHTQTTRILSCLDVAVSDVAAPNSLYQSRFNVPLQMRQDASLAHNLDMSPNFDCTYTLAGSYSDPHIDFYVIPQYIVHLGGSKIWFVWPANEINRELSKNILVAGLGSPSEGSILTAIAKFDSLSVGFVTRPDTAFVIPTGAVHAVISLERSCHCGSQLACLDELSLAYQILEFWCVEWMVSWKALEARDNRSEVPYLTKSELEQSTAPRDIAHALCNWTVFVYRHSRDTPEWNEHSLEIRLMAIKFLEVCKLHAPVVRMFEVDVEMLKFVSVGNWSAIGILLSGKEAKSGV